MKQAMRILSLILLACVTLLLSTGGGATAQMAEQAKRLAFEAIERNKEQVALVNDSLFYFGELGMQEYESTRFLKEILEGMGFRVRMGDAGFPTALTATYGSGKPVVLIYVDIDALPGGSQTPGVADRKPLVPGAPGHMEGHNVHGAVLVGAAYGVKVAKDRYNLPGTLMLNVGPAEEQLVSRPFLVRAGVFKDVDAAYYVHIQNFFGTEYGIGSLAMISSEFTFKGKTAHGAVNPWEGRDALDAAELMDIGFDKLREHLYPTQRSHRVITSGGDQPNIIPDTAKIWWFFREISAERLKENYDKAMNIARGAALMTGTTFDVKVEGSAWPMLTNVVLAEVMQKNIEMVGMPQWDDKDVALAKAVQALRNLPQKGLEDRPRPLKPAIQLSYSCECGDVSWVVPTGSIWVPANVIGAFHHWTAAIAVGTPVAHKGAVASSKALAGAVIDLFSNADLIERAKQQFVKDVGATKYFPLIPEDAKPPLELNKATMEKYRPEMSKFYLNKKVEFK